MEINGHTYSDDSPRLIGEIQEDLKSAKKELRRFWRCVGDDLGCDGSYGELQGYRWAMEELEEELADARAVRKAKRSS